MKNRFGYYRIIYSVFATAHLAAVLVYQFSFESVRLWNFSWFIAVAAIPFLLAGLLIMAMSVYKYFYHLSGIAVFSSKPATDTIFEHGLHSYVRHPLYAGTLLTIWSLFVFFPLLSNLVACLMITIYTVAGIKWEEDKLLAELGDGYRAYKQRVPMLLPTLTRKR